MDHWQELESKYFMTTGRRQPVTLVRGEGVHVWGDDGQEYLDFVGGWAVTALGHCHPAIVEALEKQARTLWQVSNQFYTVPQVRLAEILVQNSCMDKVYFQSSGAEANEAAAKLARKYGKTHLAGAYEVITTLNSFHGRTMAMVAATGQPHYQEPYQPIPEGFVNVPFNDIEAVMSATNDRTCAVMLEPIQGEGGVNIPSKQYLKSLREWCDEKRILLIFDEIQTGMGRTGTLFAYEQFEVEPDVMTLAKGLGGGIPIGAILAKDAASAFTPGDHGSTFGGNPLACAVALAVTRYILENDVLSNVQKVGGYLKQRLENLKSRFPSIKDVRGMGLLIAVEFNDDISAKLVSECNQQGLLLNPVKPNSIRLMPALTITQAEVDQGISKLESALEAVSENG